MKKTRFFSRIIAAALAVAIAAVTLITNSGMGLLVFAEGGGTNNTTTESNGSSATYSVKIISPDVPADGKTYSYNFYQIIDGDIEEDNGVNLLGNAKWGEALGGEAFDNVPTGKTPVGGMSYNDETAGIGYYPSSEVLLAALSGTMSCEAYDRDSSGAKKGPLLESAYNEYCKILNSYGVSFDYGNYMNKDTSNYFYKKFKFYLTKNDDGTDKWNTNPTGKTRDVKGLVELLNAGSKDGKLKTVDLKAFADLLLNGVEVDIKLSGEETDTEKYTYKFIIGDPQATKKVESGETYTVEGLAPGYYLVACVDESDKLTNDGYESAMPIKPVSTMLLMVGPANDGVTEIVGKNAYSVPTVTLEMYQTPVKLSKTIEINCPQTYSDGYDNNVEYIDNIIENENWRNTGSFDYYSSTDRQEAILYRIGITLPLNFDTYKDSGYFLAVLDQYSHFNFSSTNGEIHRVENVRPYVYVKKSNGGDYNLVGRYMGNRYDNKDTSVIGKFVNTTTNTLTGNNNTTYDRNEKLGFNAHDIFCFGDLYDYTTDGECTFAPGDTIYICYPAILDQTNVYTNEKYLLNANRIWTVYTNNPYAEKLTTGSGYSHVVNGEVSVTPIAEANVNTYAVTLKVDGEGGYASGAKFALYREVTDSDGKTTKEYAYTRIGSDPNTYVKWWIPESELGEGDSIEEMLLNYSKNNSGECVYLASNVNGIGTSGVKIKGLAAGEYYLQELTISSNTVSGNKNINKDDHENIKDKHYELAKEPIKFNVGNEYNQSVNGYLGVESNEKTLISKLTIDFLQEKPERAIDTYIYKPYKEVDADNNPVPTKDNITTTLNETSSVYATEDGEIEIQVYHNTINLIWLPETGGIGTTIFFIVGGTIIMAAVVMIVTRFRIKRERL